MLSKPLQSLLQGGPTQEGSGGLAGRAQLREEQFIIENGDEADGDPQEALPAFFASQSLPKQEYRDVYLQVPEIARWPQNASLEPFRVDLTATFVDLAQWKPHG